MAGQAGGPGVDVGIGRVRGVVEEEVYDFVSIGGGVDASNVSLRVVFGGRRGRSRILELNEEGALVLALIFTRADKVY